MRTRKYKRKYLNLQVQHRLQLWLLIRIGGIVIITAIISALILYGYARHETINSFYDAHIKIRRLSDLLIPVVMAGSAVSLIGGAIVAIFLPQKIAGPIFHIERIFKSVADGDLTARIRLRGNDTLLPFADQLNSTIQNHDQQIGQIQQLNDNLQVLSKTEAPDFSTTLEQLEQLLSSVKTTYSEERKSEIDYVI